MKIIGVLLIKNEDRYIERVVNNVLHFCDEILILDNYSTDATYNIVGSLAEKYKKIKVIQVEDAFDTHKYIEHYAGTSTWIFRVDGDEVYDPAGLNRVREILDSGQSDDWWSIISSTVNVEKIDLKNKMVQGYRGRMSGLTNFRLLTSWHEDRSERLHGVNRVYNSFFDKNNLKLDLPGNEVFESAYFRCLHLCFVSRSSTDRKDESRFNPAENKRFYYTPLNFIRNLLKGKISLSSSYKNKFYRQGKLESFSTLPFFMSEEKQGIDDQH